MSPARRRQAVEYVRQRLGVSERRVCRVIGQPRSTQRRARRVSVYEVGLVARIVTLACEYGRYGYRQITGMLRLEGWWVNHKRVERLWRREGLKVPPKQPKRGRLWLRDGSCIRQRAEYPNHVWSYDFTHERTAEGKAFRILAIVDEYTRECLAMDVARTLRSEDVLDRLESLFVQRGAPAHIRSDNGPEFTAKAVRGWLTRVGVQTLFIAPGSPWENGYVESFFSKLRNELLNGEIFYTLVEARVLIERWRKHYNQRRPHSSLGYRPPAPEAIIPIPIWTGNCVPAVAGLT